MHWIIFAELKKFADARVGGEAWSALLEEAGLAQKSFLAHQEYPDEDGARLVQAAARLTGMDVRVILEAFGEFLVPSYLRYYGMLVRPEWRTIDTIHNTEAMIHTILRVRDKNAKPPELRTERVGANEIVIDYSSHRMMCDVAKGISRGLAKHHGEPISITEERCMHAGAPSCRIRVRTVGS